MASTVTELLRRRFGGKKESKQYIDIYNRTFPTNGYVNGRQSFFLYLKETLPIGAKVHLAMVFTTMDSSVSYLAIKDTAASPGDITIPMPQMSFDVEFEVSKTATSVFYCYFDKSVSGVQIDMSSIVLEKIV